eukprot:SAG22_NODE_7517_length_732_cov_1.028436_1_plen_244_part_11
MVAAAAGRLDELLDRLGHGPPPLPSSAAAAAAAGGGGGQQLAPSGEAAAGTVDSKELATVQYVLGGLRLQLSELSAAAPPEPAGPSKAAAAKKESGAAEPAAAVAAAVATEGGASGGYRGVVLPPAAAEAAGLARQAVGHLRAAIELDPEHADAKYYLALQLMKRPGSVQEAAALLGAIDCSAGSARPIEDFSGLDVLLLAGQTVVMTRSPRRAPAAPPQAPHLSDSALGCGGGGGGGGGGGAP